MLTAAILLLLPLFIAGLIHAFFNKPTNKLTQNLKKSLSLVHFNKHLPDDPPRTHIEEAKNNKTHQNPETKSKTKPTQINRSELKQVFSTFDKNNDGFISKNELKDSFKNIGIEMTESEIADTVERLDLNGDGSIDMEEFCGLLGSFMGQEKRVEETEVFDGESDLREAFDVFDGDKDGLISVEELGMVLSSLGLKEGMRLENCKEMISKVDVDGDGMVNFDEFKMMMKSGGNLLAAIS